MEWNLPDARKSQYDSLVSSAKELESNIGSITVRTHRLIKMREDVDASIKSWWEEVLKEMGLDPKCDYMIDNNGMIHDVPRPEVKPPVVEQPAIVPEIVEESRVGTNANDLV